MARTAPPRIQRHRARMARSGNHRATRGRLASLVAIKTALLRSQRLFALSLRRLLHAGRAPLIVVPATKGAAHSRRPAGCPFPVEPSSHKRVCISAFNRWLAPIVARPSPALRTPPDKNRTGTEGASENARVSKNNGGVFSQSSPFSRFAPPPCFVRPRLRSTTRVERNAFGPRWTRLTEYSV